MFAETVRFTYAASSSTGWRCGPERHVSSRCASALLDMSTIRQEKRPLPKGAVTR